MKGFLEKVFFIERKIASDFLTSSIAHPNVKVEFYSKQEEYIATGWLAEALKTVLNIDEYHKLPWFGENSQKNMARKLGAAFFQDRLRSTDFPLHYYCYYIDEMFDNDDYCDYFHIYINPAFNRQAAIQKFALFMKDFLRKNYPRLLCSRDR